MSQRFDNLTLLFPTVSALLLILGFNTEISQAATIRSNFDSGLDDWTGSGGSVSHISSGGNPGGYLRQEDNDGTFMTVIAPSKFLGDLSSFLNGTLSFDALNDSDTAAELTGFGRVTFTGSAASASAILAGLGEPSGNSWNSYSTILDPAFWTGDLNTALNNVVDIRVELEFSNGRIESAGFDNFAIEAVAVPTPALLPSMIGMGVAAIRKRRNETKKSA